MILFILLVTRRVDRSTSPKPRSLLLQDGIRTKTAIFGAAKLPTLGLKAFGPITPVRSNNVGLSLLGSRR